MAEELIDIDQRSIGKDRRVASEDMVRELQRGGRLGKFTRAVSLHRQATHAKQRAANTQQEYYEALVDAIDAEIPQAWIAQACGISAAAVSTAVKRHRAASE